MRLVSFIDTVFPQGVEIEDYERKRFYLVITIYPTVLFLDVRFNRFIGFGMSDCLTLHSSGTHLSDGPGGFVLMRGIEKPSTSAPHLSTTMCATSAKNVISAAFSAPL